MENGMTDGSALVLEACVEDLDAALAAERGGAHRIELCSALNQDGLTPSRELTRECVRRLSVPVMAMVRPRGGDFVYSAAEIAQMESEIEWFRRSGVASVVLGLLTGEGRIDLVNTRRLVAAAQPLQVTFHKAIDASRDVLESLHELNSVAGLTRVLTSGGSDSAWNGRDVLRAMNDLAGRRLTLIAAGRVLPENRAQIADYTGIRELHGRRIVG
jgi:copper homeostasis protein